MLFEDKTLNNIMTDLKKAAGGSVSTGEGTLIDHSLRGAAAEFEQAYMELGMIDQNGYADTADREHLILRAKEIGMEPFAASNAVWKAEFNTDVPLNTRFSAGKLTYRCIARIGALTCRLMCEQAGTKGNIKQEGLEPVEYVERFECGELTELLIPARDDEETEAFRARYIDAVRTPQAVGGNRAQYKNIMRGIDGAGPCKIYRVTQEEKRIKIFFLDSTYKTPSESFVSDVQELIDPVGKQGEGEGVAMIGHVVDICPCASETVNIEAEITIDTGYTWGGLLQNIKEKIDDYFLNLAKSWENEERITVRILKVNAAMAEVEGIVDVQNTTLNGRGENLLLDVNAVPVRGDITCKT